MTPMKDPPSALEISALRLTLPGAVRPVLAGVDLTVGAGETVALVGESGSGKTLTSRSALGLLPAGATATGSVRVAGDDVLTMGPGPLRTLRARTAAMIFQDPRAAISPVRRIGHFLTEAVLADRVSRQDPDARAAELLDAVGLPQHVLRLHPHELSGGMLQRVMIAAALMNGPRLLLADEPTTALDVTTQAEIVALLSDLQTRFATGLLFVTHDLDLAAAISDRVYVMYAGRIVETAPAATLFGAPRHPYTAALLASTPRLEGPLTRPDAIPGRPPDRHTATPGCAFAPRCPHATRQCEEQTPAPRALGPGTTVACHHAADLNLRGGAVHDAERD